MWQQLQDANWRVAYTGGWCLKYVQDAFGTDHPYPSAIDAWNANYGNGNHPSELPPAGKTVAVYFALGNVDAGHVAISLDDGMVASSTQAGSHPQGYLHPNLQNLVSVYGRYNGGCTYLGWSEYVGTVQVVFDVAARDRAAAEAQAQADAAAAAQAAADVEARAEADRLAQEAADQAAKDAADAKAQADADTATQAAADAVARQKVLDDQAAAEAVKPIVVAPPVIQTTTLFDLATKLWDIFVTFLKSYKKEK